MTRIDGNEWPEGWEPVESGAGALFAAQLLRETGPIRGPIRGMRVDTLVCVGRFGGSDDMVFAVKGWEAPYFVAHLSWSGPDRRTWIMRRLRPWPGLAPALVPVREIADLARYFD